MQTFYVFEKKKHRTIEIWLSHEKAPVIMNRQKKRVIMVVGLPAAAYGKDTGRHLKPDLASSHSHSTT
jgi:hypothetical protein